MASLTDEQVIHVIDTINLFDKKGDGKLSIARMSDCLRALGLNPLELEVAKFMKEIIDYHNESRIDVEDFLPIYEHFLKKRRPSFQELYDGLKALDPMTAQFGSLDAVDLRIALTTIGDKLTQNECSVILDQVTDPGNMVNIANLVHLVLGDQEEEAYTSSVAKHTNIHTAHVRFHGESDRNMAASTASSPKQTEIYTARVRDHEDGKKVHWTFASPNATQTKTQTAHVRFQGSAEMIESFSPSVTKQTKIHIAHVKVQENGEKAVRKIIQ